jgi:hypothetical protein
MNTEQKSLELRTNKSTPPNFKKSSGSKSTSNSEKYSALDSDSNGLVDGSEITGYKLFNGGRPIKIVDKRGNILRNKTSKNWNAVAAFSSTTRHKLLIRSKNQDKYKILTLKNSGKVKNSGKWEKGRLLSNQGHEKRFNIDLNGDSVIEGNKLINAGNATFSIQGKPSINQKLHLLRESVDPDGNGKTTAILWQFRLKGRKWKTISSKRRFKVHSVLNGFKVRAKVQYIDRDGFAEKVVTRAITIPAVNNGDASFLIVGTPEVGETLAISRATDDPDGNGDVSVSWQTSLDGVNWINQSSDDSFTIPQNLEGHRISANISYVDGQGFNELINTDELTIPFVDNGDASFLIVGTPEVGETLAISRATDDPDGNGDVSVSWQTSLDGVNWINQSSDDSFTIPQNLEGHRISANISYVDGQGFNELINTDELTIPFVDNGDASFLIVGTPEVGETLAISRATDDPDGNGDISVSWQTSLDGVNWINQSSDDSFTIHYVHRTRPSPLLEP